MNRDLVEAFERLRVREVGSEYDWELWQVEMDRWLVKEASWDWS
jgi:hypothetical protein